MAGWLPKSMVLRSGSYEAYVHYDGGEVEAEAGSAFDTMSLIEVEAAKGGNNDYIHLRFRYTNKYWSGNHKSSIVAISNQPVEDTSDPTCTLFEPKRIGDTNIIQLLHVYSGKHVRRSAAVRRLFVDNAPLNPDFSFGFTDSDSIIRLPKEVVLKGDNKLYLEGYLYYWFAHGSYPYMKFSAADSSNLNAVGLEVQQQRDGYLRFKSKYFDKFWRRGCNWLEVNSDDEKGEDKDTWWWPIKCGPDTIALTAHSDKRFLKPLTADNKEDTLNATDTVLTKDAKMVVEEAVSERAIYNVRYSIVEHARVFDEETFLVSTETAVNSSDKDISLTLKAAQEVSTTQSFSNSHGFTVGAETTIQTGVPFIVKGEIKLSASTTHTFTWGKEEQKKSTLEGTCVVTVPPKSKATINCVATRGKCSVPFTYSQRDKRSYDGQFVTSQHVDGIFTCDNYYNLRFEHPQVESL